MSKLTVQQMWNNAYQNDRRAVVTIIQDTLKGNFNEVEDLVQEAYTNAWDRLNSYDENKASFLTWLCNVAKSTTVDYIKECEAQKRPDVVYDHELRGIGDDGMVVGYDDLVSDPCDDPANTVQAELDWDSALSQMTDQMRECVEMRELGFTNQEIAAVLLTTEAVVRSQISQSRQIIEDSS